MAFSYRSTTSESTTTATDIKSTSHPRIVEAVDEDGNLVEYEYYYEYVYEDEDEEQPVTKPSVPTIRPPDPTIRHSDPTLRIPTTTTPADYDYDYYDSGDWASGNPWDSTDWTGGKFILSTLPKILISSRIINLKFPK